LEECEDAMLATREEYWINKLKPEYNMIPGGGRPPIHYGENSPRAKLTDMQVDEIIKLLKTTNIPQKEIAKQYGVASSSIERICKGLIRAKDNEKYPLRESRHEQLDEQALKIIDLLENSRLTHKEIGAKLGVAKSTVTMINIGKNHFDPNREYPIRKLNTHQEKSINLEKRNREIIELLQTTKLTYAEIGKRYNLTISSICDINKGRRGRLSEFQYPIRK